MKFRIPFTFKSLERLKQKSKPYEKIITKKKNSALQNYLQNADIPLTREEYLGIAITRLRVEPKISFLSFAN